MKAFFISLICLVWFGQALAAKPIAIFDSHSHYSLADSQQLSPKDIQAIYKKHHIIGAQISSTPTENTEKLYSEISIPIIPFLSLYKTKQNKPNWMHDLNNAIRIETLLDAFPYQGIGEFHIFKQDTFSPVLKQVIKTAEKRGLMIQIHGDAEIIDRIFDIAPKITVLWAHLGTKPEPEFLNKVIQRHPNTLYIDTSVRDGLFVDADGKLKPEWNHFFIQNQNNILAAIDTYSTQRWQKFAEAVNPIRLWLNQLPKEVAEKIAYKNAQGLFFN